MAKYAITIGTNTINPGNTYTAWTPLIACLQARGITEVRFQRKWSNIETSQGTYDFTTTDDIASHLNANGIDWWFTIEGAPAYALADTDMLMDNNGNYQMQPSYTANFAKVLCQRYYPGSPNGYFKRLSWNEDFNITFDSPGFAGTHVSKYVEYNATGGILTSANVQPCRDPYYAALVFQAVAPVIRQYNPTVLIGLPVIWWNQHPNTKDFYQGMYDIVGSNLNYLYDFTDFHKYTKTTEPDLAGNGTIYIPSIEQEIADIQSTMVANYARYKGLVMSEFGYAVPTDCSEAVRATRFTKILNACAASGTSGNPPVTTVAAYTYDFMGSDASSLVESDHVTFTQTDTVFSNFIANNPNLQGKFPKFMFHR